MLDPLDVVASLLGCALSYVIMQSHAPFAKAPTLPRVLISTGMALLLGYATSLVLHALQNVLWD